MTRGNCLTPSLFLFPGSSSSFFFLCSSRWKQRKSVARSIFTSAAPVTPPPVRAWCLCVRQTRSCREFLFYFMPCFEFFFVFSSKIVEEILFLPPKDSNTSLTFCTSLLSQQTRRDPPSPLSLSLSLSLLYRHASAHAHLGA